MTSATYTVCQLASQVTQDLDRLGNLYARVVSGEGNLGDSLVRLEESITVKELFLAAAKRDLEPMASSL